MYIVYNPLTFVTRVIDYDNYDMLHTLYKCFLNEEVLTSWYPHVFLRTLTFTDKICDISDTDLQKLFYNWCLQEGKSYYNCIIAQGKKLYNKLKKQKDVLEPEHIEDTTTTIDVEVEPVVAVVPEAVDTTTEPIPVVSKPKGVPAFNKRKNHGLPVFYEELIADEEIGLPQSYDNDVATSMLMVCFTENKRKGVSFIKSHDVHMLKEIDKVGIKNVKIDFAMFLPDKPIVEQLATYYALDAPHDMQNNMDSIVKLLKFTSNDKKVTVIVKSVVEFFYNTYEFDINSTTKLSTFFDEYYRYNANKFRFSLNAIVDIDMFVDVLKYMYLHISDNKLMYYKPRQVNLVMSLDFDKKLEMMLKTPYIQQKTHQLRSEPQCKILSNISPWGMSSQVEFSPNNLLVSKSL